MRFSTRVCFAPEEGGTGGTTGDQGGGGVSTSPLGGGSTSGSVSTGGSTSGTTANWRDALPEAYRSNPTLTKYANVEELAKGHVHASGLIGKDPARLIEVPDTVDEKFVLSTAARLGLPENIKDYKIEAPKDALPFMTTSSPLTQRLATIAHSKGILPAQFQALYNEFSGAMGAADADTKAKKTATATAGVEAFKKETGNAFDQKIASANRALDKVRGGKLRDALIKAGLDSDPDVLGGLAEIGELLGEDGGTGGERGGAGNFGQKLTPDEARAKGKELLAASLAEKDIFKRRKLNAEAQEYFKMIPTPKGAAA